MYQTVEIFISCRSLRNADFFSESDPQVIVKQKRNDGQWFEVGRSEIIYNNLNPNFKRSFEFQYFFEEKQELYFEVIDIDGDNSFDHLGECYTTLGAIVGAKNNALIVDLTDKKTKKKVNRSKIVLIADKISKIIDSSQSNEHNKQDEQNEQIEENDLNVIYEQSTYFYTQWQGVKLMNTDGWFGKSDPFLRFQKIREDKILIPVHETEVIMDNLNPIWKPFEILLEKLNNKNMNNPIKVECWDWEKSQKFQFIGEFTFTIEELNNGKREFNLINPKKKNPGKIVLMNYELRERKEVNEKLDSERRQRVQRKENLKKQRIAREEIEKKQRVEIQKKLEEQSAFLEYIRAVDFTGSNGNPLNQSSLHYCQSSELNSYQQAIQSVGEILLDYDYDKQVPCYGFGGQLSYPELQTTASDHCFPMTGKRDNCEVSGVEGIQDIYKYTLKHVSLGGPTYFNPILEQSSKIAQECKEQGSNVYTIMLILTDGQIDDIQGSINTLVQASNLPLSVIIVGVGSANFDNMEKLDGDQHGLVNSQGQKAARDIVQFVPFRSFNSNGAELSKEVLAEIPKQLVEYMQSQGIKPKPMQQIDHELICKQQTIQSTS